LDKELPGQEAKMRKMRLVISMVVLLALLLSAGCGVSQSDYDDLLAQAEAAKTRASRCESELSDAQADLAEAQSALEEAQNELEARGQEVVTADSYASALLDQVSTLEEEVTSLSGQVSSLEDSLAAAEALAAALRKPVYIDQMPESPWFGMLFDYMDPTKLVEQSFVPTYPVLVAVEVNILTVNADRGNDTITMSILDNNGTVLVSRSKQVASGFSGWLRFDIDGGINIPIATNLFIRLEDTGNYVFGWKYLGGDIYKQGSRIKEGVAAEGDFIFRTYANITQN
jgi:hypothetical protein